MKNLDKLTEKLSQVLSSGRRYLPALFGLLLVLIYGFLTFRIQTLNSQEPTALDISQQSQTAQVPHIDPAVVRQLTSLKDNSVNVQTLFDQARGNPFQE